MLATDLSRETHFFQSVGGRGKASQHAKKSPRKGRVEDRWPFLLKTVFGVLRETLEIVVSKLRVRRSRCLCIWFSSNDPLHQWVESLKSFFFPLSFSLLAFIPASYEAPSL